jgi:hypothetical protein
VHSAFLSRAGCLLPAVCCRGGMLLIACWQDSDLWVAAHNKYRSMHCAPDVKWNSAVAADAQAWANRGVFTHSQSYDLKPPAGPAGPSVVRCLFVAMLRRCVACCVLHVASCTPRGRREPRDGATDHRRGRQGMVQTPCTPDMQCGTCNAQYKTMQHPRTTQHETQQIETYPIARGSMRRLAQRWSAVRYR